MSRRGLVAAAVLCVGTLATAGPVLAQTVSPPPKGASVQGEVTGALEAGSTLTFTVDATMPGGWEALHLVEIVVLSGDQELERLAYDIEDVHVAVGDHEIVVGTGAVATGEHLRVSGADVVVTTGAGNLSFHLSADVARALPEGVRFRLGVEDDFGVQTQVTKGLTEPADKGITWSTVVTAVLVALLAGGLVGNVFASKRRPAPRASVYGAIDRRIRSEREANSDA